jgi:hypothetical protein
MLDEHLTRVTFPALQINVRRLYDTYHAILCRLLRDRAQKYSFFSKTVPSSQELCLLSLG